MFVKEYLEEVAEIAQHVSHEDVLAVVNALRETRTASGRLFILGVGGSAGMASHAVNDFRKICGIEAYTPVDNVSELTAITNDHGWEHVFEHWLIESNLNPIDTILVYSVGGGSLEEKISVNLVYGIQYAQKCGCKILSIVGRDGGFARKNSDASVLIPTINTKRITPHVEGFAGVITHLLVTHPLLMSYETTWESRQQF